MRTASMILIVAGCASPRTAPPALHNVASPPAAVAAAPSGPPSCADTGKPLRDIWEGGDPSARQAMFVTACTEDRWSESVIACVVTRRPDPDLCLEWLGEEQTRRFSARLLAVTEPPTPPETLCEDVSATGTLLWAPVLTVADDDEGFASELRDDAITRSCHREAWGPEVRDCLVSRDDAAAIAACRGKLDATQAQALAVALADADTLWSAIAKLKQRPERIACPQVALAHYSDAAWRGKADALSPGDHKRLVARSRADLIDTCDRQRWSANHRACVVAGGGAVCFGGSELYELYWGFYNVPFAVRTGIPACDRYGELITNLWTCPGFERDERQKLLESYHTTIGKLTAAECQKVVDGFAPDIKASGCRL